MSIGPAVVRKAAIAWAKNAFGFLARHREYIALALLILIVSVISSAWNIHDTRPMPKNDAHAYLASAFRFVDAIGREGLSGLSGSVRDLGRRGRPPLYQLLSVPFIWLFGRAEDAAISVNLLFQGLLLLSTYGIGRLAKNGRAGLLAALVVAAYPPVLNLSRIYMPHYAVIACVAVSLWLLMLLLKTRAVKVAWLFGASLGFGALIRHYFPVFYLGVPTVIFGVYMLLFQTNPRRPPSLRETPTWLLAKLRDPFVLRGLLPGALIAMALTVPWYVTEGRELLPILGSVSEREEVMLGGFPGTQPSFWWYALTAPGAISVVFALLLGLGLVVGIVKRQPLAGVLIVAFVAAYCTLCTQTARGWVNFAPVLPVAAALTAAWVVDVGDWVFPSLGGRSRTVQVTKVDRCGGEVAVARADGAPLTVRLPTDHALWDSIEEGASLRITRNLDADAKARYVLRPAAKWRISAAVSTALVVICVVVAVFNFSLVTWGVQPWSEPFARALGAPLDSETCSTRFYVAFCPNPPMDEDWHIGSILQIIADDPECQNEPCVLMVVPLHWEFDESAFAYYRVRDFLQSHVQMNLTRAMPAYNFNGLLMSDYLVYAPDQVRYQPPSIWRFLRWSPAVFAEAHEEVASFALPPGWRASLIKRVKPLTSEEAVACLEAVDLSAEERSQLLVGILDLFISH